MEEFKVVIPDENYQIVKFCQEDLPGIMVLNKALSKFEPKEVFSWHLSVMINLNETIDNGMPSKKENGVVTSYGDYLDRIIKDENIEKPNALFLARITWNKTRELIYRVFDPEPANDFLEEHIELKEYKREFDYRIDPDKDWELASWHLGALNSN